MRVSHADRELMEEEDYKFAPTINKKSSSSIKLDFFQRQEQFRKSKYENLENLYRSTD